MNGKTIGVDWGDGKDQTVISVRIANAISKPFTSLYSAMKEYPMFETAMFCDLMQQFCHRAHQNSKDKGFWDEGQKVAIPVVNGATPVDENDCMKPLPPFGQKILKERPINYGEKYMLMVSELCELFEAHRKGTLTAPCDKPCHIIDPTCTEPTRIRCEACNGKGTVLTNRTVDKEYENQHTISTITFPMDCKTCAGQGLITTTGIRPLTNEEEEIADVLIRVADYCGYRNIDLGAVILSKMAYNKNRPHMHNKTC